MTTTYETTIGHGSYAAIEISDDKLVGLAHRLAKTEAKAADKRDRRIEKVLAALRTV